jgi:hypothetical protein
MKFIAFLQQVFPDLFKIVDLSVEDNNHALIITVHGLTAIAGHIHDGQPPVAKTNIGFTGIEQGYSAAIWSAVMQGFVGSMEVLPGEFS